MPRYYIECHEDGDSVATHQGTVDCDDEALAIRKVMLEMFLERGRVEETYNDDETEIIGYEGLTAQGSITEEEMLDICFDEAYVDCCVEVPEGLPAQCPSDALEGAVDELLNNRAHLDLHEDDRAMLVTALEVQRKIRAERAIHSGGIA